MKKNQLERGNEIQIEIRQLNEQLENWQKADKLKTNSFVQLSSADDYSNISIRPHYIDFDKMKNCAIDAIKNELAVFEKEFESL